MYYVYIIATKNAIKIGVSDNPEEALEGLQTSSEGKIRLVHKEPVDTKERAYSVEKRMLHSYKKYKAKDGWFKGLSIVKTTKALKRIKDKDSRDDREQKIYANRLKKSLGVLELQNFIRQAKELDECCFVLDTHLGGVSNLSSCLLALSKSSMIHLGHINKHGSVFREYDSWNTIGRKFIHLGEERLC